MINTHKYHHRSSLSFFAPAAVKYTFDSAVKYTFDWSVLQHINTQASLVINKLQSTQAGVQTSVKVMLSEFHDNMAVLVKEDGMLL